jgi:hypothetical protein
MMAGKLRDCVFWVADNTMAEVFKAFLTRDKFHMSLGCGRFDFDPRQDIFPNAGGNDPGLYVRAHHLVADYALTHKYAVVALDAAWDGSPEPAAIEDHVSNNLAAVWAAGRYRVIVIEPELEAWVLHDNPHVATAFRYNGTSPLRHWLRDNGHWPEPLAKPPDPKAAVEALCRFTRTPRSAAVYAKVVSRITVKTCIDHAFRRLAGTLCEWFPPEAQ